MPDMSIRITNNSKTLIDLVIPSKNLPNLTSQIEFVDTTDHCAIHVSYPFFLEKPFEKIRKTVPFLYNPAGNNKFL